MIEGGGMSEALTVQLDQTEALIEQCKRKSHDLSMALVGPRAEPAPPRPGSDSADVNAKSRVVHANQELMQLVEHLSWLYEEVAGPGRT